MPDCSPGLAALWCHIVLEALKRDFCIEVNTMTQTFFIVKVQALLLARDPVALAATLGSGSHAALLGIVSAWDGVLGAVGCKVATSKKRKHNFQKRRLIFCLN